MRLNVQKINQQHPLDQKLLHQQMSSISSDKHQQVYVIFLLFAFTDWFSNIDEYNFFFQI